jgi:hypothetical protein
MNSCFHLSLSRHTLAHPHSVFADDLASGYQEGVDVDAQTLVMLSSVVLIGENKTKLVNLRLLRYCRNRYYNPCHNFAITL